MGESEVRGLETLCAWVRGLLYLPAACQGLDKSQPLAAESGSSAPKNL